MGFWFTELCHCFPISKSAERSLRVILFIGLGRVIEGRLQHQTSIAKGAAARAQGPPYDAILRTTFFAFLIAPLARVPVRFAARCTDAPPFFNS